MAWSASRGWVSGSWAGQGCRTNGGGLAVLRRSVRRWPGREVADEPVREPAVETELTAEEAAPLLGTSAETLVMLIEAGAGWRYFRTHRGLETRAADGTVVGLQPLTPEGDRFGPAVAIFNERDDL